MAFDMADFRAAMSRFSTGVTVVTTTTGGRLYGVTVNAFCSVSLSPPLVLVSLEERSHTRAMIHESGVYGVNLLTADQQSLARHFARRESDGGKTFTGIPLHLGETGVPLFDESLACVECRVVAEYPGGDHFLVLGEVLRLDIHPESIGNAPLLYYRSSFSSLPGDARPVPAIAGPTAPAPTYAAALNGHANGSGKRLEHVEVGEDATTRKRRFWFRDNSRR
jgi:flavin reductase (DIM6/NTAB) family NADH-FMN oxidoreductase RutF